jgi:hypothetical protein
LFRVLTATTKTPTRRKKVTKVFAKVFMFVSFWSINVSWECAALQCSPSQSMRVEKGLSKGRGRVKAEKLVVYNV